jgi:hypothetical protein
VLLRATTSGRRFHEESRVLADERFEIPDTLPNAASITRKGGGALRA